MNLPIFHKGAWVVQTRGRYRGRIGRVADYPIFVTGHDNSQIGFATVQFGADGPFNKLKFSSMRLALDEEIPEGVA